MIISVRNECSYPDCLRVLGYFKGKGRGKGHDFPCSWRGWGKGLGEEGKT